LQFLDELCNREKMLLPEFISFQNKKTFSAKGFNKMIKCSDSFSACLKSFYNKKAKEG